MSAFAGAGSSLGAAVVVSLSAPIAGPNSGASEPSPMTRHQCAVRCLPARRLLQGGRSALHRAARCVKCSWVTWRALGGVAGGRRRQTPRCRSGSGPSPHLPMTLHLMRGASAPLLGCKLLVSSSQSRGGIAVLSSRDWWRPPPAQRRTAPRPSRRAWRRHASPLRSARRRAGALPRPGGRSGSSTAPSPTIRK